MQPQDHERQKSTAPLWGSLAYLRARFLNTLRAKVLVLLLCTVALLLIVLFIPLKQIFLNSFSDLEQRNIETDLMRAKNVLDSERELQEKLVLEYGAWDDTYHFVVQPDQTYIDDNYAGNMLANRHSSLVLIADNSGKLVFGRAYDLETNRETALPRGAEQLYAPESKLLQARNPDQAVSGIVNLPDETVLVSAYPIITSLFEGPQHGVIIFGHSLGSEAMREFSKAAQLPIEILRPDAPQLQNELSQSVMAALGTQPTYVQPISETEVAGYMLLPDLDGKPGVVIRIAQPRDIYQREQTGVYYAGVAILIISILFTIVLMLLLDRLVISRLTALNNSISQIGTSGNLATQVPVDSNDELGQLAATFNTTLQAIDQAQRDRERAKAEALAMNQRFIATVSHELRTPLTPIQGYVELLQLDGAAQLSEEQASYLEIIQKNVSRMAALIEDILVISNLNSKDIVLHIAPTNLPELVRDVIAIFQVTSDQKQIAISTEIDEQIPALAADNRRLYQILWNLLSNAIKYTPSGGKVWLRAFARDDGLVEIQVEDNGVGISAEQQSQLFTPFYRAENPLSIAAGGTGLGLSIVRDLVELHHGTIWVTSTPGVGSLFALTIPIAHAQPTEPAKLSEPA